MKTVALGEIVDFYSGGTPSKSRPEFWQGKIPWFSAKDIKRSRLSDSADHISETVFRSTSLRKLPAGTIVMVVRGMILAHTVPISILDVESAINQDLKALLPRREIDPSYLAAMLRAQHNAILSGVSTAAHGTKKLDSRVLEEIRIPLPAMSNQKRIASLLARAEELCIKSMDVVRLRDSIGQSVLMEAISGEVPRVTIGESVNLGSGSFLPAAKQLPGPYPVYGGNGVNGHHSSFLFDDERVVISRVGAYCGVVHLTPAFLWVTDNALYVRSTNIEFANRFLAAALTAVNLNKYASKSGQPLISASRIANVRIPAPDISVQLRFEERVRRVESSRASALRAVALSEDLFACLQARAFRGEL